MSAYAALNTHLIFKSRPLREGGGERESDVNVVMGCKGERESDVNVVMGCKGNRRETN